MMRGLWSGVSGLQAHQIKMDVIGDNIANINTTGFKKTDVIFTDFMSQLQQIAHGPQGNLGGTNAQQIGLGTSVGSMTVDHSQGALQRTDRTLDCAVQGSGYFVVEDGNGGQYYTRNGHFELDADGTLTALGGMKVQGWQAEADAATGEYRVNSSTNPIDDIQIKMGDIIPAKSTTKVDFNGNLNSANDFAIDPVEVEWITGGEGSYTASKIKIEFEHTHPTENFYVWKAVWSDNPPAGFRVGDAVIDSNTGANAEGIIELDDNGKVIGNYINTNNADVANASEPVSYQSNKGNIDLAKVDVRNQSNVESALWQVRFDQSDTERYSLYVSTDNGSTWNRIGDESGESVKDANQNDIPGGIASTETNTVFTYVTGSDDAGRKMYGQLTLLSSDWSGTAQKGDVITFQTGKSDSTADYNQITNLPTEKPKEEDDWPVMVATNPTAANTNNSDSGLLNGVHVNRSVKLIEPLKTQQETLTFGASGGDNDILVQVKSGVTDPTNAADRVSVEFLDPGRNNAALGVYQGITTTNTGNSMLSFLNQPGIKDDVTVNFVVGTGALSINTDTANKTITVNLAAAGSTADEVRAAINSDTDASNLIIASFDGTASDGSGTMAAESVTITPKNIKVVLGTDNAGTVNSDATSVAGILNSKSGGMITAQIASGNDGTGIVNAAASEDIDSDTVFAGGTLSPNAINFTNPATGEALIAVDGYVLPSVTYTIEIPSEYNSTTNPVFNVKNENGVIIATGRTDQDFNAHGIYIKKEAWSTATAAPQPGKYVEFTTTQINPSPANYKVVFNNASDSKLYDLQKYDANTDTWVTLVTNQSVEEDLDLEHKLATNANNITAAAADETIKIPWTNWTGTFNKGDEFYFSTHKSVSEEPGHRDFFRVKDASGRLTEIFVPSGSLTGADPITFQANTTEVSTAQDTTFKNEYNVDKAATTSGIAISGAPVTAIMNNKDEYQFVTNIDVYDSLGRAHNLPITFERKGDNLWQWSVKDPCPDDPNNVKLAGYGLIGFKADGTYDPASSMTFPSEVGLSSGGVTGPVVYPGIYFDPSDWGGAPVPPEGADPVMIMPDFSELVQYASSNDAELAGQDGYAKGTLTEIAIDGLGTVTGLYDNGYSRDIAQIALANFNNESGLLKMGNSMYRTTSNSGNARVGTAGTGGRGSIASNNLEQSNVDMSYQFTSMITTQRGFQANSRIISTEDQLLQELLTLKR